MIIKIGKFNFAVNGEWSRLLNKHDPVDAVKDKRKRFYTLIEADVINIRYLGCYNIVKSHPKLYSLASCFSDLVDDAHTSFIFVHSFDNKLYYLAYRDGVFDIKTDKALSVNDAKKNIREYVQSNEIKHLYYFDDLNEADSLMIDHHHKLDVSKLGPIDKSHLVLNIDKFSVNVKTVIAFIFFITLIGLISYSIINEYFADAPIVEKVKKGPSDKEIADYKANQIKAKLSELYLSPYPADLLSNCDESRSRIPLNIHFWDRILYICSHSDISYTYIRGEYGYVPSEFKDYLQTNFSVDSISSEFTLPIKVTAKYLSNYPLRDFIPESREDISVSANDLILDVLSRYSDLQSVNSLSEPKFIPMGYHELKGEEITFKKNELFKTGSFTLRSSNFSDLIKANSLFESDYTFLENITYKGDFYDAKYTYIVL